MTTNIQQRWIGREVKPNRVPAWADQQTLMLYYETCKALTIATGRLYNVDHIIPINGNYVSGLHVPDNLQIITSDKNKIKGNKLLQTDLCSDSHSGRKLAYREIRIQNALNNLVDRIDTSYSIPKFYKDGKRVSQQTITNYAKVRKKSLADFIKKLSDG